MVDFRITFTLYMQTQPPKESESTVFMPYGHEPGMNAVWHSPPLIRGTLRGNA